ncbi:hypothetical protein [Streptomyces mirabilis]|uniref:hypothetical protein n=1 Tax=Streptomyces mirabilis TaxID=68239 RepID=UPI003F4D70E4
MNETNAGGVRQRSVEIVVPVHNEAHVLAATGLTARLPHVHAVHLAAKGRGRALKYVWSRSEADVVAYILESGQPVISMGGWSGSDNAMTLAKLKSLVKSGKLHYIIVSSDGGQGTNSEIATWVKAHGTAVKSSAYSSGSSSTTSSSTSSASSTSSTSSTGGLYRLDASDVG